MIDPRIKTKVVHSKSKPAWNVVSVTLGIKYKIARVPYVASGTESVTDQEREYAKNIALFISKCINKSKDIF